MPGSSPKTNKIKKKKLFTHPSFLIAPLKNILAIEPIIGTKEIAVYEIKTGLFTM